MIVDEILNIIGKFIPSEDEKLKLQSKIEETYKVYSENDTKLRIKELESTGFKSYWRPLICFMFAMIVVIYSFLAYIVPMIIVYFNLNIWILTLPEIDPHLWDVVLYSILGIAGLRSIDKRR